MSEKTFVDQLVYVTNKCLIDFVRHVNALDPEIKTLNKKHYKVVDKMARDHLDFIRAEWLESYPSALSLAAIRSVPSDSVLAHEDVSKHKLLQELSVSDIVMKVPAVELPIVRFYMYAFVLFGTLYEESIREKNDAASSEMLSRVLQVLQKIQGGSCHSEEDMDEIVDDDIRSILVRMMQNANGTGTVPPPPFEPNMEALQNTSIGSLAKEISEEIDLSKLNIERPEDIFNLTNLMGGGGAGGNNVMSSIITKVGSKIQDKLQKGELKHEDLMRDAFSFLNTVSGAGAGAGAGENPMAGFMNNPMMQQMMSSMMGGSKNATRERLRKKLNSK